ncbi:MAG: DegT/DnrJ/EryC1/StrS family aminotransferase [Verrucomicrobiae bacterium]|nr:DegT/DnrJ/EryC1/StrS family aminotransferase [Verrucomicrobiae bacterium]
MKNGNYTRREFIKRQSMGGLGAVLATGVAPTLFANSAKVSETPAVLGGPPVRTKGWSRWPIWEPAADEKQVLAVLRSGVWSRAAVVSEFEKKWAATIGAKRCLAVVNGTNALITSLKQLDIGGGDEVIVTPYTWIATVQAILQTGAMPVFADVDPETFQIDPEQVAAKITPRTRAILPVHILGLPADMVRIMQIARKHNLVVVEDCCQAWLAEINHKKVGTFGNAGCFSFQNSKNITTGEGGAIVSDDEKFMDRCYSYHNFGRQAGAAIGGVTGSPCIMLGTKLRFTEYQAAIGLAQLQRLEEQTATRVENAAYLRSKIKEIPGILPYRLYDNVTRAVFHLFPFRYQKEQFQGLSRAAFLEALKAEGIPCSEGYTSDLNKSLYLKDAFQSKNFRLMYPKEMLDFDSYVERNRCPKNDQLCEEAVWLSQNMLLGTKSDMDDIAAAIEKIHRAAGKIRAQTSQKA